MQFDFLQPHSAPLKKALLILGTGMVLALGHPLVLPFMSEFPINSSVFFSLLGFVVYVPLFIAAQSMNPKQIFFAAFSTHIVYFFILLYWIVLAIVIFGEVHLFVGSFALLQLSALISLYISFAFFSARAFCLRYPNRLPWWIVFPVSISSTEYLRNYVVLGGFPWGNLGYSLYRSPILSQGASVVGVYGLTFFMLLINALLAEFFLVYAINRRKEWKLLGSIFLIVVFWVGFGFWRLQGQTSANTIQVAIVQGNIEQGIKNQQHMLSREVMQKYAKLHQKVLKTRPDVIIWPETALPLLIPSHLEHLFLLPEIPSLMVVGGVAAEGHAGERRYYNSAFVVGPEKNIIDRLDKIHLVPFGEYVPWPLDNVIQKIVPFSATFSFGRQMHTVRLPLPKPFSIHLGATLCYEGVFPEISRSLVKSGANLLVNLTNDAWYGVSSAPYQHLNMYRFRSIETGRSFVRSTNTGISAWVDSFGIIHRSTPLYQDATWVASVPIETKSTLYVAIGDVIPQVCLVVFLFIFIMAFAEYHPLRLRSWYKRILGLTGITMVVASFVRYGWLHSSLDESDMTRWTFFVVLGLILAIGAIANQQLASRLLRGTGFVLILLGIFFSFFYTPWFMILGCFGALLLWLERPRQ